MVPRTSISTIFGCILEIPMVGHPPEIHEFPKNPIFYLKASLSWPWINRLDFQSEIFMPPMWGGGNWVALPKEWDWRGDEWCFGFWEQKVDDLKNPDWPKLDSVAVKSMQIRIGIKKWIELKCGAKTERNPCKWKILGLWSVFILSSDCHFIVSNTKCNRSIVDHVKNSTYDYSKV